MPGPINSPANGHYGYVAFHAGKRIEVYANSSLQARDLAAKHWNIKPKKYHEVSVILAEKDGKAVTHTPTE